MTPNDEGEFARVEEILAIHVPDTGLERRMMQKQQRWPIGRSRQYRVKPAQRGLFEFAMRLLVYA
jgi:hypothetical protein